MAAAADPDRIAIEVDRDTLTAGELLGAAWAGAKQIAGAQSVAYVGTNGLAFPVALFAAAAAGVPFSPLNYRLGVEPLDELVRRLDGAVVIGEGPIVDELGARGHQVLDASSFLAAARADAPTGEVPADAEAPAVLLFTSGTTAAPKAAVLRHRHLTSYVIGTVEFAAAEPTDAVLVSVPPYHIAGIANLVSNLYAGRRIVYLRQFDAAGWVDAVRTSGITHAMVVPTMLARIADVLDGPAAGGTGGTGDAGDAGAGLATLRSLSYGGSRTPAPVVQRIMAALPDVDLTNAYGLTETSSTIAVLGPDDHRAAASGDPIAVGRLASAGKVLPTIEVDIRDGEIWVRGEQVSGEYAGEGAPAPLDADGWFPTKDRGWVDDDGYLFVEGRSDDTIIRGGENIAPAEIEAVLLEHPAIRECAVVGVPDDEWGQRIAAVVVLDDGASLDVEGLREFARRSLRGSKTPEVVRFVSSLPYTDTGKLLRRQVQADLA